MSPASLPAPRPDEGQRPGDTLLVPADLDSLPFVGARLHAFARDMAGETGDAKEVHDLRLAVQEACANIIKHGALAASDRRLLVRFDFTGGLLSVLVTSRGEPFDPRQEASLPSQEFDFAEGGYGLFLIQALVDRVDYLVTEGGNTLVLAKRLPPGDAI